MSNLIRETAAVTWSVGADGYVVDIPEWSALTGQSAGDISGEGWMRAIHPDDVARVRSAWMTAVAHGSHYNTDYRLRCADGVYRWFNARGIPVVNVEGVIEQWVGVVLTIAGSHRFGRTDPPDTSASYVDITPGALRAARAMLGWSASKLAEMAQVSLSTVRRIEDADERDSTRMRTRTVSKLIAALARQPVNLLASVDGVIDGVSERAPQPAA